MSEIAMNAQQKQYGVQSDKSQRGGCLFHRYLWVGLAMLTLTVVIFVWLLMRMLTDHSMRLTTDEGINITPEQIQSIRDIGQWEFLAVSDEELVDTVRRGFFKNDRLSRIYYGTVRIGVDLTKVREGWLTVQGDTVVAVLPPVGLLDDRFIDEARTRSFHESGRWTASDREALYEKARRQMLRHALTPANLRSAESQADEQFRKLLQAMGFKIVEVRFEK